MKQVNCMNCGIMDCHNVGLNTAVYCSNYVQAKVKSDKKTLCAADRRKLMRQDPNIRRAIKEAANNRIIGEEKW